MTGTSERELEERLAALTRWENGPADVWRNALDETAKAGSLRRRSLLRSPVVMVAAAAALVIVAVVLLPDLGKARSAVRLSAGKMRQLGSPELGAAAAFVMTDGQSPGPAASASPTPMAGYGGVGHGGWLQQTGLGIPEVPAQEQPAPLRSVVRKATIELGAADVRTAFLKAAQIVSEAGGEYVESSSLTGTGPAMRANLTLRVAADRLSSVLNGLRELGTVRSEESRGDDVTTQVVDLDARLRNERRVEAELLELLDKRTDSPLKDVLELRNQINAVRLSIEQLVARQQQVARSVSMATVLVIIGPADAPSEPQAGALGEYFAERLVAAWTGGLRFLAETLGAVLRALVGGLLCWLLLAALVLVWRQHRRHAAAAAAAAA